VIFGLPAIGRLTANTVGSFDLPPIVALAVYLAIVVVFFQRNRRRGRCLARPAAAPAGTIDLNGCYPRPTPR
jgi:hypothetical protein